MNTVLRIGPGAFRRRLDVSSTTLRVLEARGVVNPIKTEAGWRSYSEDDVRAVQEWKRTRKNAKR